MLLIAADDQDDMERSLCRDSRKWNGGGIITEGDGEALKRIRGRFCVELIADMFSQLSWMGSEIFS